MSDKFEKLLDLLVNEQKEDAEKLFHDIVVEKSREIYEGILAEDDKSEEVSETEKSSDKAEGDEVDEAKEESKDSEDEEVKEESNEEVEEETVEEIGGDQTDDLLSDIEAEADGMEPEMGDDEGEGDEAEASDEVDAKFDPLEKELDALKAEFAKMMDGEEAEESIAPELEATEEPAEATEETVESKDEAEEVEESTEKKDADTLIREYSEQVKADLGDHADNKKSPNASSKKIPSEAKAVKMDQGGEETGGVGKAFAGDTAKDMGVKAKNEPGIKSAKLENAPKADEGDHADNKTTPVAKK